MAFNRFEEMIDTIRFEPYDGTIGISGSYLDVEKNMYIHAYQLYYLKEDLPVTAERLYVTEPFR